MIQLVFEKHRDRGSRAGWKVAEKADRVRFLLETIFFRMSGKGFLGRR